MKNNRDAGDIQDSSDPEADNYHGHRPSGGSRNKTEKDELDEIDTKRKGKAKKRGAKLA